MIFRTFSADLTWFIRNTSIKILRQNPKVFFQVRQNLSVECAQIVRRGSVTGLFNPPPSLPEFPQIND